MEFIWMRSFVRLADIPQKEAADYSSPERQALGDLPQTYSAKMEKVNALARFIDSVIQVALLAFDSEVRFIQAPAGPDRSLAVMKGFCKLRTILHHPAVHEGYWAILFSLMSLMAEMAPSQASSVC
jgi:hypothetical protein